VPAHPSFTARKIINGSAQEQMPRKRSVSRMPGSFALLLKIGTIYADQDNKQQACLATESQHPSLMQGRVLHRESPVRSMKRG